MIQGHHLEHYYELARIKNRWGTGLLKLIPDFITDKFAKGDVKNMLEVGCGLAEILKYTPEDIEYHGVDPAEYAIQKCKELYPRHKFVIGEAEGLPFEDNSFDLILSIRTLEMLSDPKKGLSEMARVVRPGGYIILEAPNFELPWARARMFRHYSQGKRLTLLAKRFLDLFSRSFGVLPFRTIPQNFSEATGKLESGDDDARYITSAFEVVQFYKRRNFKILYYAKREFASNSPTSILKNLTTKIPVLKYAATNIFLILQRPENML